MRDQTERHDLIRQMLDEAINREACFDENLRAGIDPDHDEAFAELPELEALDEILFPEHFEGARDEL